MPMKEYRMKTHLFGATSSPSCANFALRCTADDCEEEYGKEVADTIRRNFYVDDCLRSTETEDEAIVLAENLRRACKAGGFHLNKWTSNSHKVIASIPKHERAADVKLMEEHGNLPASKVLGVMWSPDKDSFGFKVDMKENTLTRRGMLSTVSSLYDPLGFVCLALLPAKQMLQDLCRMKLSWDEPIPKEVKLHWEKWLQELPQLSDFTIERCLKPKGCIKFSVQMHHFSDASNKGYETASYLRFIDDCDDVHVSLVMAKARVAPLKEVTIPRLELQAATMMVKMNNLLCRELQMEIPTKNIYFWTDSQTVLKYVNNDTARFHTYVANRVTFIRENSDKSQWKYVETSANPADDCSRGLPVSNLIKNERWTSGPEFLYKSEDQWPHTSCEEEGLSDDPEVKKNYRVNTVSVDSVETMEKFLTYFSFWFRLRRYVAWILRLKKCLKKKMKAKHIRYGVEKRVKDGLEERMIDGVEEKVNDGLEEKDDDRSKHDDMQDSCISLISTDELREAERAVIAYVQRRAFCEEWECLSDLQASQNNATRSSTDQRNQYSNIKKTSHILKLKPRKEGGVLRVGGRLAKAALPEETKYPMILPKQSHITELIMQDTHVATGHSGRNHMLAHVRKKYWVINANSVARRIITKCVTCRRQKSKVGEQQMADLPEDRVKPDKPPFSYVGVDYFGPFETKKGRSLLKRYGVVFTCLTTRAIHLEMAESLDTDSCINAIRRFVARRGQVKEIRSDNGTNLVGAQRELKAEIRKWNVRKIHDHLLQKDIVWKFNPPAGSHVGGIWERQIRTVRKIMMSIIKEQVLTDERLRTWLCKVEAIVNGRPNTTAQSDADDLEPLTPNHLLLLKGKPNLPPIIAEETSPYARRRWKQVQYLANVFWTRWTKEYLLQLQERQKWVRPRPNFKQGDVVLIADSPRPRNTLSMGRVIRVLPDKEGFVRQVELKTKTSVLVRPIHKLCLLLEADIPEEDLSVTEKTQKQPRSTQDHVPKKANMTPQKPASSKSPKKAENDNALTTRSASKRISRPPKRLDL